VRSGLLQKLSDLRRKELVGKVARTGNVTAGPPVVSDDPELDWRAHPRHDDGYRLRCLRESAGGRHALDQYQVRSLRDELGRKRWQTLIHAFCHERLQNHQVAAFAPT